MLASTYCLTAGPLSPLRPSPVARVTATPPIVTTALALAVKVPAVGLLMVSEQVAVLPPLLSTGLLQLELEEPGGGLAGVPIAAKVRAPAPAGKTMTGMVKGWGGPTWVTALGAV